MSWRRHTRKKSFDVFGAGVHVQDDGDGGIHGRKADDQTIGSRRLAFPDEPKGRAAALVFKLVVVKYGGKTYQIPDLFVHTVRTLGSLLQVVSEQNVAVHGSFLVIPGLVEVHCIEIQQQLLQVDLTFVINQPVMEDPHALMHP